MTTRDHQADELIRWSLRLLACGPQKRREEVAFQVVDGMKAATLGVGNGLAQREPHEKRTNETRTLGGGDDVHVAQLETGFLQRGCADRWPVSEMFPRGDLRDHAAKRTMRLELTRDRRRQDAAIPIHHRAGRVVAGGLDPQSDWFRQAHPYRD